MTPEERDEAIKTRDHVRWAAAFCTVAMEKGFDANNPDDEDWIATWFANAMMRGYDDGARDARNEALEEAATAAAIHSQYPVQEEYDRGYGKARKDAAAKIRSLKTDSTP